MPQQYWDEAPAPRLTRPPPGSMVDFVPGRREVLDAAAAAAAAAAATARQDAGRPGGRSSSAGGGGGAKAGAGAGAGSGGGSGAAGLGAGISLPDDLDDIFAGGLSLGGELLGRCGGGNVARGVALAAAAAVAASLCVWGGYRASCRRRLSLAWPYALCVAASGVTIR